MPIQRFEDSVTVVAGAGDLAFATMMGVDGLPVLGIMEADKGVVGSKVRRKDVPMLRESEGGLIRPPVVLRFDEVEALEEFMKALKSLRKHLRATARRA